MSPAADPALSRSSSQTTSAYRPLALVGDIGRTHIRFALSDLDELTISNYALLDTGLFSSPVQALEAYLRTTPERPEHVGIAVAAEVRGDRAVFQDRDWTLETDAVLALTKSRNVRFVTELEALALSLPHLASEDLVQLGGMPAVPQANMAVVSAGTGLGVAGVLRGADQDRAVVGEGGHVAFAAADTQDFEISQALVADQDFVSAEQLISGPGLVSVYQLMVKRLGRTVEPITPKQVVDAATAKDEVARQALALFIKWLGRFAGDAALTLGAQGGMFIAGGIPPRILPALQNGAFRAAFEHKGRLSPRLAEIPVHVVTTPNAGLIGATVTLSGMVEGRRRAR